jgi:hypothetical protein
MFPVGATLLVAGCACEGAWASAGAQPRQAGGAQGGPRNEAKQYSNHPSCPAPTISRMPPGSPSKSSLSSAIWSVMASVAAAQLSTLSRNAAVQGCGMVLPFPCNTRGVGGQLLLVATQARTMRGELVIPQLHHCAPQPYNKTPHDPSNIVCVPKQGPPRQVCIQVCPRAPCNTVTLESEAKNNNGCGHALCQGQSRRGQALTKQRRSAQVLTQGQDEQLADKACSAQDEIIPSPQYYAI